MVLLTALWQVLGRETVISLTIYAVVLLRMLIDGEDDHVLRALEIQDAFADGAELVVVAGAAVLGGPDHGEVVGVAVAGGGRHPPLKRDPGGKDDLESLVVHKPGVAKVGARLAEGELGGMAQVLDDHKVELRGQLEQAAGGVGMLDGGNRATGRAPRGWLGDKELCFVGRAGRGTASGDRWHPDGVIERTCHCNAMINYKALIGWRLGMESGRTLPVEVRLDSFLCWGAVIRRDHYYETKASIGRSMTMEMKLDAYLSMLVLMLSCAVKPERYRVVEVPCREKIRGVEASKEVNGGDKLD
jgi:hypothetical protein